MFHRWHYLAKHELDQFDGGFHSSDKLDNESVRSMAKSEE